MTEPLDQYLLRAYLDGEMDEATAQAFEIRMIERPDLAELVDADYALGAGLRDALARDAGTAAPGDAAAPGDTAASAEPPAAEVIALPPAKPARAARPLARAVPWLAAAGVAFAVGLGAGRVLEPGRAALEPAALAYIDKVRSAPGRVTEVALPADGKVVLFVPVATAQPCRARVDVRQGARTLGAEATTDAQRYANFVVDASLLAPGDAEVAVGCAGQPAATYAVRFTR